jgi:hypothetical protein
VQKGQGILGQHRRRWAWVAFLALAAYAPIVSYLLPYGSYTVPDDTWMLSVTVAGLVATVLIIDDVQRRQRQPEANPDADPDLTPPATTD